MPPIMFRRRGGPGTAIESPVVGERAVAVPTPAGIVLLLPAEVGTVSVLVLEYLLCSWSFSIAKVASPKHTSTRHKISFVENRSKIYDLPAATNATTEKMMIVMGCISK